MLVLAQYFLKCGFDGQKNPKKCHISVCNFYPITVGKKVSQPTFFNIFAWNFKYGFLTKFGSYQLRFLNLDFGAFLAQSKRNSQENFASKPDQKVDPLSGPFGSPVISKKCFQLFWPPSINMLSFFSLLEYLYFFTFMKHIFWQIFLSALLL